MVQLIPVPEKKGPPVGHAHAREAEGGHTFYRDGGLHLSTAYL